MTDEPSTQTKLVNTRRRTLAMSTHLFRTAANIGNGYRDEFLRKLAILLEGEYCGLNILLAEIGSQWIALLIFWRDFANHLAIYIDQDYSFTIPINPENRHRYTRMERRASKLRPSTMVKRRISCQSAHDRLEIIDFFNRAQ